MMNLLANIGACGVDNRVLFFIGLAFVILTLAGKRGSSASCGNSAGCGCRKGD